LNAIISNKFIVYKNYYIFITNIMLLLNTKFVAFGLRIEIIFGIKGRNVVHEFTVSVGLAAILSPIVIPMNMSGCMRSAKTV